MVDEQLTGQRHAGVRGLSRRYTAALHELVGVSQPTVRARPALSSARVLDRKTRALAMPLLEDR